MVFIPSMLDGSTMSIVTTRKNNISIPLIYMVVSNTLVRIASRNSVEMHNFAETARTDLDVHILRMTLMVSHRTSSNRRQANHAQAI